MPSTPKPHHPHATLLRRGLLAAGLLGLATAAAGDGEPLRAASAALLVEEGAASPPGEATVEHHDAPIRRYVALGDSYTAAPDAGPLDPDGPPGCIRSTNDHPHLVAEAVGAAELVDVSCTGATTASILGPQRLDDGTEAPAQIDAVTGATDVVTVGIGGNDIGFADVLTACLAPSVDAAPCHVRFDDDGPDGMDARLDQASSQVDAALDEIGERAPEARVLVVGYPAMFPAAATDSCFGEVRLTDADVAWMHEVEGDLNDMLATQAEAHGLTYVDAEGPSAERHACAVAADRWVEGLFPASPAMSFHPNAARAAASADAVLEALGHR